MAKPHRICSIPECCKPAEKRGWCGKHYQRWRVNGDPNVVKQVPSGTCMRWIEEHVDYSGDGCLIWPYSRRSTGYAQINIGNRPVPATRVMCAMVHGEPPAPNLDAAHSCGKGHTGCIHPKHLRWATRSENLLEKRLHGTISLGEKASSAVLTEAQVKDIVAMAKVSSERKIAKSFGVHRATINCILSGRSWSWLTGIEGPQDGGLRHRRGISGIPK